MDEKNKSEKYFMERLWDFCTDTKRTQRILFFLYDEKKKRGNRQDFTDCKMIEEAARESSEELAPYLLKSVTDDLSYEYLEFDDTLGRIPVGKTDFYGYRRKFYDCLLKKRI